VGSNRGGSEFSRGAESLRPPPYFLHSASTADPATQSVLIQFVSSDPMNSAGPLSLPTFVAALRPALPGLFFALLTLLFGFGMGIVFGLNEDAIKSRLAASAAEVRETAYRGNDVAIKAVLDKSWAYMQRAHLHAGSLGTSAIALTLLVVLLGSGAVWVRSISLGLGAGGLGYAVYWMLAGFRAPGMGSTGAAKESLSWIAMPASGAVVLATVGVAVLLVARIRAHRSARGTELTIPTVPGEVQVSAGDAVARSSPERREA
jgi:hypothetical protein